MSPRYFAKFSQHPKAEENWFHFSPKGYAPGSPELKLYVLKVRIINFLKKPFTR